MKLNHIDFNNFKAVEIVTKSIRLVITTNFGPRIAFWGRPDGENLLLWAPGKYLRKKWELLGGHRVWVTRPLADECEETYLQDNYPCEVRRIDSGWTVVSPENEFNYTQRGLTVRVLSENTVEIDNFLVNKGEMLYSGGIWALTCTVPREKTCYGIPLGEDSAWDFCKIVMYRKWNGHSGGYDDDQFSFKKDMMVIQPKGKENKRMVQAHKGIIAMHDSERNIMFAKKISYNREGNYPNGCNMAVYIGPENFMVEMETLGVERTIKPGAYIHHKELWVLESADKALDSKVLEQLVVQSNK